MDIGDGTPSNPVGTDEKITSKILIAEDRIAPRLSGINWYRVLIIYAAILFILNLARCFANNFWCDECYTIMLSYKSFGEIITTETSDMHPPLYHLIVKLACVIFGYSPPVYHFVSLVPFAIVMLVSITFLRKEFGICFSFIFITFISLLYTSVEFITQARMYEWALLFVFFAFIEAYLIIKNNNRRNYVLFISALVLCAYTHYFSLMAAGLIGIMLLLFFLQKKNIRKLLLVVAVEFIALLLFSPWAIYFIDSLKGIAETEVFWADEIPPFLNVLMYLFFNPAVLFFLIIIVMAVVYILKNNKIVKVGDGRKKQSSFMAFMNVDDNGWAWVIIGLAAVFGSIAIAYAFSFFIRPMFGYRYVYPVAVISWVIVAYCISKCKARKVMTIAVLVITLSFAVPQFCVVAIDEYQTNQVIGDTLDCTRPYMTEDGDCILDTRHALDWMTLDYYYPEISHCEISLDGLPDNLDPSIQYWLFLTESMNDSMKDSIESRGYGYETVKLNGNIGSYDVWVYKLIM